MPTDWPTPPDDIIGDVNRMVRHIRAKPRHLLLGRVLGQLGKGMRLSAGLSQAELGARMGWHRPIVCRFERGIHVPDLASMRLWAHHCGRPFTEFTVMADRVLGLLP